jgi:hypothetical protein
MSSGDTIKSGSGRKTSVAPVTSTPAVRTTGGPKPFIPKRAPPMQSVYTEDDYDADGKLKVLRKVPLGDAYKNRQETTSLGTPTRADYYSPPVMPTTPKEAESQGNAKSASPVKVKTPQPKAQSQPTEQRAPSVAVSKEDAAKLPSVVGNEAYPSLPGKPDRFAPTPNKHRLGQNKFDVQTPEGMGNRDEQYIAVIRTIENRHPDEDRLLQKYALQYVARQNNTYNPIEDPPVVLSELLPTCVVVIDRIFSRDEANADENRAIKKYVKKLADRTDLDVVPVYVTKPFHVPLHPMTTFKYKDKVIDQIMHEFYESQQESASEILDRVEADRDNAAPKQTKWQVYDGISPQGAFGPKTIVSATDVSTDVPTDSEKTAKDKARALSWAEQCEQDDTNDNDNDNDNDNANEDEEDDENEEEPSASSDWKVVEGKPAAATKRGGVRRGGPRKK